MYGGAHAEQNVIRSAKSRCRAGDECYDMFSHLVSEALANPQWCLDLVTKRSILYQRKAYAVRSGPSWLSLTSGMGLRARVRFSRRTINRSSSAVSSGLLCLPPLWISSSLCINSAKCSMLSPKVRKVLGKHDR
jgi:hypothetical protein